MNPNAKEFVPAHLLKKRQDESVSELSTQIGNVDIDDSKEVSNPREDNETSRKPESVDSTAVAPPATTEKTPTISKSEAQEKAQEKCSVDSKKTNGSPKHETKDGSQEKDEQEAAPHNASNNHRTRSNNSAHQKPNGDCNSDPNEDDRYLLKAGENYCEFNGEQFIIPGEDEEYTGSSQDYPHPGYDFGNAEDNEDEDVCNAYEEFLNDLPQ